MDQNTSNYEAIVPASVQAHELPAVQNGVANGGELAPVGPQEKLQTNPNQVNQNQGMSVGMQLPAVQPQPLPATLAQTPPPAPSPVAKSVGPSVADDVDVIEKEWVDKAKAIVNQTKNDPYRQEEEVEKLQADYLNKRYGKQIKLRTANKG